MSTEDRMKLYREKYGKMSAQTSRYEKKPHKQNRTKGKNNRNSQTSRISQQRPAQTQKKQGLFGRLKALFSKKK